MRRSLAWAHGARAVLLFLAISPRLAQADVHPSPFIASRDVTVIGTSADGETGWSDSTGPDLRVGQVGAATGANAIYAGGHFRAIIAFDLSSIPRFSTVTSAVLTLYMTRGTSMDGVDIGRTIDLYRIASTYASWHEGAISGLPAPNPGVSDGAPTYCYASYFGFFWGCGVGWDHFTASTGGVLATPPGPYTWTGGGVGVLSDVQNWVNDVPANNAGWLVYNESESSAVSMRTFGSRESATPPSLDIFYKMPQGASGCGADDQCATGHCTNGVCCNVGVCPGAQACNSAVPACQAGPGTCSNPVFGPGTQCRASAGACDPAENCNGSSAACPGDAKSSSQCRPSLGACDPAEFCDGSGNNCPGDAKSSAQCRGSAGACDPAEFCNGVNDTCPADLKSTAQCRASGGACDPAEFCDGSGNACPGDAKSSAVCRPSVDVCDLTESCDGVNPACPADAKSSAVCRPSLGVCDPAESCSGGNSCPADLKSSAVCRPSQGACDPAESCNGVAATCPTDLKSSGVCRPAAGVCDVPESCTGGDNCPADGKVTATTPCADEGNPCTLDQCDGSNASCQHPAGHPGAVCRPAGGVCDIQETCTGASTACPTDVKSTAVCRASGGVCDLTESCNGSSVNCPADLKSTAVCRGSGGVCDVVESCDGVTDACPGDGFVPGTTQCRAPSCASGTATLPANCTGSGPLCPNVVTQSCAPLTCSGNACGGNCTTDLDCAGGLHCVDQICCDTTCGGGDPTDCQACNVAGHLGTCFAAPNTYTCRAAAGVCDAADKCNGSALTCPADGKQPTSTVCRPSVGACDADDKCNGIVNTCGTDLKQPNTFVCRSAAGVCDADDKCSGSSDNCGADTKLPVTTVCRIAAGACDVDDKCDGATNACTADAKTGAGVGCPDDGNVCTTDKCDGASALCQHAPGNPGIQCRAANGTACDQADTCSGTSATCTDTKKSSSTICRIVAGECDVADACDGSNDACPTDAKVTTGTTCSDDGNVCTADRCDGASVTCQHPAGNTGTACRAANGSACDIADTCNGTSTTCIDAKQPASFVCRVAGGACDAAETCTGTADACPADKKTAANTPCADDGQLCTKDTCDGASSLCQHPPSNAGTVCRAAAGGVCDSPETCNGTTPACPPDGYFGVTTQCRASTCSGGTETVATNCTGTGPACPAATTKPCGAFVCGANKCLLACATDTDCAPGNFCGANKKCTPKGDPGASCSANTQCLSSFCTDGVCCNVACGGQCEACNLSGSSGTCSVVTGAPVGSRAACPGDGTACAGTCGGIDTQSCSFPGSTTECRPASCKNGLATLSENCTGSGTCPTARTQDCGAGVCGPTACKGCKTDEECGTTKFCRGGVCNPLGGNGTQCSRDGECGSGHCVDGVCCNSDCTGQCEVCNDPTSVGTCKPNTGDPVEPRSACKGAGAQCGGTCDGTNGRTCSYPGFGVACHAADCQSGVASLVAFCDGNGACPAAEQQVCPVGASCVGTLCAGTLDSCTTTCSTLGTYCAGGVCVKQKDIGAPCNAGPECTSSYCVDGMCCEKACGGQCEACDVSGSEGQCLPVGGAPHGSRQSCATDGSTCAGECDGVVADRCHYKDESVSCRTGSCNNGVAILAAVCQGDGSCGPFMQQDCGAEVCDQGHVMCDKGCRLDSDCAATDFCSGGVCLPRRAAGSVCGADIQCALGHCVDHVCCDTACTGQCESCNQTGSRGTCHAVAGTPRGGRAACPGSSACGGFCDGTSRTACAASTSPCGVSFCVNGAENAEASCANAICVPATPLLCDPYSCDDTGRICLTSCTVDADCAPGLTCAAGVCHATIADGGIAPDASVGTGGAGGGSAPDGGTAGGTSGSGGVSGTGGASTGVDSGVAHTDAGTHGAVTSGDKGSCGCRVPGARSRQTGAPVLIAAGMILFALGRRGRSGRSRCSR